MEQLLLIIGLNLTFQLVLHKHDIPHRYNNALAHKWGEWCTLCVCFWTGSLLAAIFLILGQINYLEFFIAIFAAPGIVVLLINKTLD